MRARSAGPRAGVFTKSQPAAAPFVAGALVKYAALAGIRKSGGTRPCPWRGGRRGLPTPGRARSRRTRRQETRQARLPTNDGQYQRGTREQNGISRHGRAARWRGSPILESSSVRPQPACKIPPRGECGKPGKTLRPALTSPRFQHQSLSASFSRRGGERGRGFESSLVRRGASALPDEAGCCRKTTRPPRPSPPLLWPKRSTYDGRIGAERTRLSRLRRFQDRAQRMEVS